MQDESLRQLLRSADADAAISVEPASLLAQRVRQHATRRRRRRRITTALLLLGVLSIPLELTVQRMRSRSPVDATVAVAPMPPIVTSPPPMETLRSIEFQRRYHEQTATAMLARLDRMKSESTASAMASAAIQPFASPLRQQRDQAALILLDQGDRARQRFNDHAAAAAAYRDAIRLFPDSPAALAAAQRLRGEATSQPRGNES